jgi:hypothetical protein
MGIKVFKNHFSSLNLGYTKDRGLLNTDLRKKPITD